MSCEYLFLFDQFYWVFRGRDEGRGMGVERVMLMKI